MQERSSTNPVLALIYLILRIMATGKVVGSTMKVDETHRAMLENGRVISEMAPGCWLIFRGKPVSLSLFGIVNLDL